MVIHLPVSSVIQWVFIEHLVYPKSYARDQAYSSRHVDLHGVGTVQVTRSLTVLNTQIL